MDMGLLRKRSLLFTRASPSVLLLLSMLPGLLLTMAYGWPKVLYSYLPGWVVSANLTSVVILSNVPDFVSIVIYCRMQQAFEQQEQEQQEQQQQQQQQQPWVEEENDPYGGIWVGGGDPDIDQNSVVGGSINDPNAVVPFQIEEEENRGRSGSGPIQVSAICTTL